MTRHRRHRASIALRRDRWAVLRLVALFLVAMAFAYASGVLLERYGAAIPFAEDTTTFSSNIPMHQDEPLLQRWLVDGPGLRNRPPEFVSISRQPWCSVRSQSAGENMEYLVLRSRGGWPLPSVQNQLWCAPGSALSPREVAVWRMPWAGRPLWAGLLGNAAIYFVVVVAWSSVFASRFAERVRRGRCAYCKYQCDDLGTCPECGRNPHRRDAHGIWRIGRLPSGV